jgi:hypothetical protein
VRWIHTIGTGVDRFPLHAVGNAILTCSRGGSAIPIAESSCVCPVGFVEGPGSTRDDLLSVPAWLRRST